MDYAAQIAHLHELALKFGVQYVLADQTGVGEAVIEQLKAAVPGSEGLIFTVASKLDIANGLKFVLEQKRIDLPDHRTLLMQLNGLSTVIRGDRIIFDTDEKEHDDHAWSLMLAVKAANRYVLAEGDEGKESVLFGEPFIPLTTHAGIEDVRLF
jgi:phage FluMu gp28-like protein